MTANKRTVFTAVRLEEIHHQSAHELGQADAQKQSGAEGEDAHDEGLHHQDRRDGALAHAHKHIEGEFPAAALHQETAGIDDQQAQHNGHEDAHAGQSRAKKLHDLGVCVHDVQQGGLGAHSVENVEDGDADDKGEEIDGVIPHAAADIAEGELKEHGPRHLPEG